VPLARDCLTVAPSGGCKLSVNVSDIRADIVTT